MERSKKYLVVIFIGGSIFTALTGPCAAAGFGWTGAEQESNSSVVVGDPPDDRDEDEPDPPLLAYSEGYSDSGDPRDRDEDEPDPPLVSEAAHGGEYCVPVEGAPGARHSLKLSG